MQEDQSTLKLIIIVLIITGVCLTALSQILSWGSLSADVSVSIANVDASLDAEFNEYKIDYIIKTVNKGKENKTEKSKIFLTGMGDFQKQVGEVVDSYKDKDYTIKALIYNNVTKQNDYTNISVATHVDLIPWWPIDMAQSASITVSTPSFSDTTQEVRIKKVWFELWTGWDKTANEYKDSKVIWEKSTSSALLKMGDSEEYSADLTLDKNYGKVGLVGYAEVEVIDSNGESVNKIITPFTSTTHPATVNIYTIEQSELFGVLLMIVAFPLTLISIIFGMIAIPLVFKRHRFSSYLLLSAGIIGALALIFYINGLFTLVNLLDSSVKETLDTGVIGEGFNLNYGVLLIPITTVIMFFIGSVLAFLNRIPKAEAKAIAERKKLEAAGVPIPHPPPDFEPSSGEEPITFRVLDDAETKNAVQPQPSKKHKHKGRKRKGSKEKSKVNND